MEKFWLWLAYKLPRPLVYWTTIRAFAHATTGKWGTCCPGDVKAFDLLDRWGHE